MHRSDRKTVYRVQFPFVGKRTIRTTMPWRTPAPTTNKRQAKRYCYYLAIFAQHLPLWTFLVLSCSVTTILSRVPHPEECREKSASSVFGLVHKKFNSFTYGEILAFFVGNLANLFPGTWFDFNSTEAFEFGDSLIETASYSGITGSGVAWYCLWQMVWLSFGLVRFKIKIAIFTLHWGEVCFASKLFFYFSTIFLDFPYNFQQYELFTFWHWLPSGLRWLIKPHLALFDDSSCQKQKFKYDVLWTGSLHNSTTLLQRVFLQV